MDAHGGAKEEQHERLWKEFAEEIIKIVKDPRFEEIRAAIRPGSML